MSADRREHRPLRAVLLKFSSVVLFGIIALRQMSRTEHALTTTFYFCITSLVGAVVTAGWGWPMPSATQWLFLLLIGLLGTAAQFLFTAAFRYAEASVVAPIEYTGIVVVTTLGYAFFDELPGASMWVGAPLVIVAGLLIVWSEYRPVTALRAPYTCARAEHDDRPASTD